MTKITGFPTCRQSTHKNIGKVSGEMLNSSPFRSATRSAAAYPHNKRNIKWRVQHRKVITEVAKMSGSLDL